MVADGRSRSLKVPASRRTHSVHSSGADSTCRALRAVVRETLSSKPLSSPGLPTASSVSCLVRGQHDVPVKAACHGMESLTIVALSNPVLYPPSLSEVGNLGPVFVWIRTGAEGAAGA